MAANFGRDHGIDVYAVCLAATVVLVILRLFGIGSWLLAVAPFGVAIAIPLLAIAYYAVSYQIEGVMLKRQSAKRAKERRA